MTLDEFQSTLSTLYDAAIDTTRWPDALATLARVLGARAVDLVLVDQAKPGTVQFLAHNLPNDSGHQAGFAELAPVNPRMAFTLGNPAADFLHDSLFIDEASMDRSDFYAWIERTGGIRYYLGVAAMSPGAPYAGLSAHWSRADGLPNELWRKEALILLRSHLERALQISSALATGRTVQSLQQRALKEPEHALFVLDEAGAVLFQSERADALLGAGTVVRRRDRFIEAVHVPDRGLLERLVREAAASLHGNPLGASGGHHLHDAITRRRLPLTVTPFPAPPEVFSRLQPAVLVILPGPHRPADADPPRLVEGFGFTAREAEVAALLLGGLEPKQIAARLDVSVHTVRTHLGRLLEKAGVRRQTDLIRRLAGLG